ncbi:type II secretion system protein [Pontiella sp.]|uniref:type II secretion system protein n=1 Tax=Pontiella sp. TaxID=2837462 RepID=UPI0035644144
MKTRGFTLIELLVVMVILALLMTFGSKGLRAARINAKKAQARIEMKSIETGVMAYFSKYGKLPSAAFDADRPFDLEASDNRDVIGVLMAQEEDEPLNPAGVVFLEEQTAGSVRYTDPWGHDYIISLDTDYDGLLTAPDGTTELRRKVGVVSIGLFETMNRNNTNDYIYSWQ